MIKVTLKLKRFQEEAIGRLLDAAAEGRDRIVLKSCTGSGKTVVLANFAERLMKARSDVAVVWFTPGTGDLEMQSKAKMDRYVHGARTKTIADVLTSGIEAGETCFVNWEKLNKKSSLALKESERLNLIDRISDAADSGTKFVAIIDESHTNNTEKAKGIVGLFRPGLVIRASATPAYGLEDLMIEVPEDDVIEQGLVKKNIVINQDVPHEAVVESEVEFLLQKANAKRIEIRNAFRRVGENVNPLVVIQLPDADERLRAQVEAHLANLGVDCESGRMAIWLSEEHRNTEGIDEPDAKQEFIIIKQAVAVGWDCPRAHVLVKLRDNMTEVFQIQTIGRIRRMPKARHYEVEVLDNCYIYTLDTRFIDETKAAMGGQAWEARTLQLKKEHAGFTLISEQRETPHMGFDARQAHEALRSHFVEAYSLMSEAGNRPLLAKAGFVFERRLRDTTQSGSVRHADAKEIRALEMIELEVKASHRDLHDACNNQLSKMARDTGIEYSELAKIFRRLFLKGGQRPKGEEAPLGLEQAD